MAGEGIGRQSWRTRDERGGQDKVESLSFVIAAACAVLLCGFFMLVQEADSIEPACAKLDGRINPNVATVESLIRLPGVGIVRAASLAAYRDAERKENGPVFSSAEDLQQVRGIGPKTSENISQWLKFE